MSEEHPMRLYQVTYDGQHLYVAGRSMADAIAQWRHHWQTVEPEHCDPSEEPEQVTMLGEGEYEVFVKPAYQPPGEFGKEG